MWWIVIIPLLLMSQGEEQTRNNKQVTELAKQYYTAYEAGDLDVMLGMTQVPWYLDGQSVVRSQDALRIELKKLNDKRDTSLGKRVPDVKLVASFAVMKARMPPKDREMLEQVVTDDDYLALVMLKSADATNKKTENVVLFARIKDGKSSVIGVKHTQ